jgi:hypothetical protein
MHRENSLWDNGFSTSPTHRQIADDASTSTSTRHDARENCSDITVTAQRTARK